MTVAGRLDSHPASGVTLRGVADLRAHLEQAKRDGKAAVIFVWASWCSYCRAYERLVEDDAALHAAFDKVSLLRIDVTEGDRPDMRVVLGLPAGRQPLLVFLDAQGRFHREMDTEGVLNRDLLLEYMQQLTAIR